MQTSVVKLRKDKIPRTDTIRDLQKTHAGYLQGRVLWGQRPMKTSALDNCAGHDLCDPTKSPK
jgi:hypothetical protein